LLNQSPQDERLTIIDEEDKHLTRMESPQFVNGLNDAPSGKRCCWFPDSMSFIAQQNICSLKIRLHITVEIVDLRIGSIANDFPQVSVNAFEPVTY